MVKIPRCMSTQHPDNINTPFFCEGEVLGGPSEVTEAFYVFSQVGCTEQMWDSEGKEVDNQVVEKLLSKYTEFFSAKPLGKELFLTYRVPNPSVEKAQGKILLETLHSIPRAFDAARAAGSDVAPVFEVILPMTTSTAQIERVRAYYEKIIIGKKNEKLDNVTVREWVGDFQPENINVIPLFEDLDAFVRSPEMLKQYLKGRRQEYQRVFLARSDPALNYSSVSSVLMAKTALQNFASVEEETGIDILPILGVGAAPFRGNFRPYNVTNCSEEYPSVQTFTAQSSFKYDHEFREVANAVDMLNHGRRRPPMPVDEKKAMAFVTKMKREYQKQITLMADMVNAISKHVPSRRTRKLHVGLFGYSRSMKGITLPRAIKFCASFYSIGLPPELLGLSALNEKEFDQLHTMYIKLDEDLRDAARYVNRANLAKLPKPVAQGVRKALELVDYEEDQEHAEITSRVLENHLKGRPDLLAEDVKAAAWKRRFLG